MLNAKLTLITISCCQIGTITNTPGHQGIGFCIALNISTGQESIVIDRSQSVSVASEPKRSIVPTAACATHTYAILHIFAKAFKQNVLITTEETLIPFLRLIRTAWVQKEQMENISEIVNAAQNMVDRVALFCEENSALEGSLDAFVKRFKKNSARLVESDQSIVGAAWKAINHGLKTPTKHELPPIGPALPAEGTE